MYYGYVCAIKALEIVPFLPIINHNSKNKANVDFWQYVPVMLDIYCEFNNYGKSSMINSPKDYDVVEDINKDNKKDALEPQLSCNKIE